MKMRDKWFSISKPLIILSLVSYITPKCCSEFHLNFVAYVFFLNLIFVTRYISVKIFINLKWWRKTFHFIQSCIKQNASGLTLWIFCRSFFPLISVCSHTSRNTSILIIFALILLIVSDFWKLYAFLKCY